MNAPTTGGSLSLATLEKCTPSALQNDKAKYLNQRWMIPNAVCFAAVAQQN